MKQKLYAFGLITSLVIFTGVIFKVNHWPGAGWMLTIGIMFLVVFFIPAALINNYRNSENKNLPLYFVTWLTCFVVFTAMLFKVQHWPGAGIALTIAIPFPYVVFLPVFLAVTSKNRNFNIYNTVVVLLLLALNSVFSALLALNVARSRMDDSLNLTMNYNRVESVLTRFPEKQSQNPLNQKINDVLETINEYRDLILKYEGITREQWINHPESLMHPDASVVSIPLYRNELRWGEKLENGLKVLVDEIDKDQGDKNPTSSALIFNYKQSAKDEPSWSTKTIGDTTLSWLLTYLDGLEVNLNLIKTSTVLSQ